MRTSAVRLLLVFILLGLSAPLFAQFYNNGVSPSSVRWRQIRTPDLRLVYPDDFQTQADRMTQYFDAVRSGIGYGYRYGPMRMPVAVHTQNFSSNGLVMWAPKRMELIGVPDTETYATPWLKHLIVHEYRHVVQFANVNRGVVRAFSWLFGQQASLVGSGFMPLWFMEGDAVMAETEMSDFGRGRQPSQTLHYRAVHGEWRSLNGLSPDSRADAASGYFLPGDLPRVERTAQRNRWDRRNPDRWFCGSDLDHVPNRYQIGYQLVSYAYDRFERNIGDDIARHAARRPYYLFFAADAALAREYRTSVGGLFRAAWSDLDRFWSGQPPRGNSARIIPTPWTSHTTYTTPILLDDTTIIALKSDLDRHTRIVAVDTRTGGERTLVHTGSVHTPLTFHPAQATSEKIRVYWSEYRSSAVWDQRVNGRICYADLVRRTDGTFRARKRVFRDASRQALFPVETSGGEVAYVRYHYDGHYSIERGGADGCHLPDTVSVHGLAWDDRTERFYFIGLSDAGMWIGSLAGRGESSIKIVKPASRSTLSHLRAHDGTLYYTSIQSGRDEGHRLDPETGREDRITDSRYGSFAPLPGGGGTAAAVTTYTAYGHRLALQPLDPARFVPVADPAPQNVVNPPRRRWPDAPNIDSMRADTTLHTAPTRFRRGTNLVNVHSWAPAAFDPGEMLDEYHLNVNVGATVMSQSLLNDLTAILSYAWTERGSRLKGRLNYDGWAPKIEVEATLGPGSQLLYLLPDANGVASFPDPPPRRTTHFSATGRVYLPLRLSSGYHVRTLVPQAELEHNNALLYDPAANGIDRGMQKLSLLVQYTDNVRMAARDLLPRWGYAARIGYTSDPFNGNFGNLWSGFLRTYLPGVAPHHSLTLRAGAQRQSEGLFLLRQKEVFPRGAEYDFSPVRYLGTAADYRLPLWHPEGGIPSLFYLRRVRLNLLADYARFEHTDHTMGSLFSYGGELTFDVNFFRLPNNSSSSVTVSVYRPNNLRGVVFGANVTLPL